MMYFFLNMSTFDVHLRTLGYVSLMLRRSSSAKVTQEHKEHALFLAVELLEEERVENVHLLCELGLNLLQLVQPDPEP